MSPYPVKQEYPHHCNDIDAMSRVRKLDTRILIHGGGNHMKAHPCNPRLASPKGTVNTVETQTVNLASNQKIR